MTKKKDKGEESVLKVRAFSLKVLKILNAIFYYF